MGYTLGSRKKSRAIILFVTEDVAVRKLPAPYANAPILSATACVLTGNAAGVGENICSTRATGPTGT